MALTTKVRLNTQAQPLSLTNSEVATNAGIVETKLSFTATGGHNHDGTNSTLVSGAAITGRFVFNEIPTGTVNGTNTVFVLSTTPSVSTGVTPSVAFYLNGVHLRFGTSNTDQDCFISGNATVTTTFIPTTGDVFLCDFVK